MPRPPGQGTPPPANPPSCCAVHIGPSGAEIGGEKETGGGKTLQLAQSVKFDIDA